MPLKKTVYYPKVLEIYRVPQNYRAEGTDVSRGRVTLDSMCRQPTILNNCGELRCGERLPENHQLKPRDAGIV